MRVAAVTAAILSLLVTGMATAQQQTLTLDPTTSHISFTLDSTLHMVHGKMTLEEGTIRFDPAGGAASGKVVIDATSADTDNKKRDKKMHGEVLETGRFPEIVFTPDQVTCNLAEDGSSELTLTGTVLVHGMEHQVSITGTAQRKGSEVTAVATVDVPFVQWGMSDPSVFIFRVEKVVTVELEVSGSLSP